MGTLRITQRLIVDRILNDLTLQGRKLLDLQDQLATGQRVNKPSDDPLAARRAVSAITEIAANEQYVTNISTIGPYLVETETAVMTSLNLVQRARELTLQGASNTNSQEQRDALAEEINEVLEQVVVEANHLTGDRYVFAGSRTKTAPFVTSRNPDGDITAVSYAGNSEEIEIEISEGVRVAANTPGDEVFLDVSAQSTDIFETLIDIRDNLKAGNVGALTTRLEELNLAENQLQVATARLGAVTNRIDRVQLELETYNVQLESVRSDNIDADFAEVIVNLNTQSNTFQAALNAGARVLQPSLLDFLG